MAPSYDYNATVSAILQHRSAAYSLNSTDATAAADQHASIRLQHLQSSVELFTDLSSHCPMTPLLWMQYADDAAEVVRGLLESEAAADVDAEGPVAAESEAQAAETRLNILELAIDEFPGCALLRLRHLEALVATSAANGNVEEDDNSATIRKAFHDALSFVGRGSHRNEDGVVAAIYRRHVQYLGGLLSNPPSSSPSAALAEEIGASYFLRAECPMKEENDTLSNEINTTQQRHPNVLSNANDRAQIEDARIHASKLLGSFANLEDSVDVAMAEEYIMIPSNLLSDDGENGTGVDWKTLLSGPDAIGGRARYLLGLGGAATSAAFAKYAGALANRARKAGNKMTQTAKSTNGDKDGDNEEAKNEQDMFRSLAISVYERGLAECPTVESLWVAYIQCLMRFIENDRESTARTDKKLIGPSSPHISLLESACARSVRNCPYSSRLVEMKMKCLVILAEAGAAVFDPDTIMEVATEAIKDGFLPTPEAQLEVHLAAIRHVQRRILALSCTASPEEGGAPPKAFDQAEPIDKSGKKKKRSQDGAVAEIAEYVDIDAEAEQELRDLMDDAREMYDAIDSFLKKEYSKWTEGQAVVWSKRAHAEANIILPLLRSLGDDDDEENGKKPTDAAVRCFEKSVKVHQPTHPDLWMDYIKYVQNPYRKVGGDHIDTIPVGANAARFRKVRGLFNRALSLVKANRSPQEDDAQQQQSAIVYFGARDYASALSILCHEFLSFEQSFGSDQSLNEAEKTVRGKLRTISQDARTDPTHDAMDIDTNKSASQKRAVDELTNEHLDDGHVHKKAKLSSEAPEPPAADATEEDKKTTNLKVEKKRPEHTVRIGKLDFPAHPYTVRVSNLSLETEDMDLVDAFKPQCGAIVHARIVREKHHGPRHIKAKSKGNGLIQFEEKESVEKALELDGEIGLHEKLVQVQRSHIPAASIVPPGMHRVKPKGEGRNSKRNQKRKEPKAHENDRKSDAKAGQEKKEGEATAADTKLKANAGASTGTSLGFVPRGLKVHQKPKADTSGKK